MACPQVTFRMLVNNCNLQAQLLYRLQIDEIVVVSQYVNSYWSSTRSPPRALVRRRYCNSHLLPHSDISTVQVDPGALIPLYVL